MLQNVRIAAGFDGVEIHGANGFLIDQFTHNGTNTRTDAYSSSINNRLRFCLEIMEQVCATIDPGKVGIPISPTNKVWGIQDSDHQATFSRLTEQLNEFELAYLHVLEPHPELGHEIETIDYMTSQLREIYKGTLITNGSFTKNTGNQMLNNHGSDAIAFGLPFIANPDLVERFVSDTELAIPEPSTFYTNTAKGYTDYPPMKMRKLFPCKGYSSLHLHARANASTHA